jgi:hypothetical protein
LRSAIPPRRSGCSSPAAIVQWDRQEAPFPEWLIEQHRLNDVEIEPRGEVVSATAARLAP